MTNSRFARRGRIAVPLVALSVLAASCSSSGTDVAKSPPSTTGANATAASVDWKPPTCDRKVASAPKATPVKGSTSDFDLTSFDGATIRIHWFPRTPKGRAQAPTVLMGPGWSLPGDTNVDPKANAGVQSVTSIAQLRSAGYNVATWDPRGFGKSTGTVEVDSADFEAKDVSKLIDWVAKQPGVQLDGPGNPRLGMVGMSYGGGIQFVTAATDCRVDVITPSIAWNSLATSLYQAETVKAGWSKLLVSIATTAKLDSHILSANEAALATGSLSQDDRQWFVDRGPDYLLSQIKIPTLIIQGTVDNLFPLAEGARNFTAIQANGAPVAMTWFCGGHGACLTKADPTTYVHNAVFHWLARYLTKDAKAPLVPAFQTVDQNGVVHRFDSFPPASAAQPVFAFASKGTLVLQPDGGSGPLGDVSKGDVIGGLAKAITPAKASKGLDVPVVVTGAKRLLLGAPDLRLGYSCSVDGPMTKPTRMFAQLVDDKTGKVLGNQVTPIAITCDGLLHQANADLEMVAHQVQAGDKLTLQLVATSVAYAVPQMGGTVDFARIELTIPSVTG